jgi:ribonuclease HI
VRGVGVGIVIKRPEIPNIKLMYRMHSRCSNNQAEAYEILKTLEYIKSNQLKEEDKTITLHTDSMTTLDSLLNTDKHIPDRRDKTNST